MASLIDFAVAKRGQQINITGKILDDKGQQIADFGPNGTNFVPWFQQLSVDEQLELVRDVALRYIVSWAIAQGAK